MLLTINVLLNQIKIDINLQASEIFNVSLYIGRRDKNKSTFQMKITRWSIKSNLDTEQEKVIPTPTLYNHERCCT